MRLILVASLTGRFADSSSRLGVVRVKVMSQIVRKEVLYSGRVQGVGFRFTAQRLAAGFDVTGYVRNRPDGRVELVVEGNSVAVDDLLGQVADTMSGYIDTVDSRWATATGEFASFEIRL